MNTILAGCILLNEKREVLLLHRETAKYNHWEVPGGKVEPGETSEQAAVREIKEELGVDVHTLAELGVGYFDDYEYHYFLAETNEQPVVQEPDTFKECGYLALSKELQSQRSFSDGVKKLHELMQTGEINLEVA